MPTLYDLLKKKTLELIVFLKKPLLKALCKKKKKNNESEMSVFAILQLVNLKFLFHAEINIKTNHI